jgi:hypothetical protein
MAWAQSSNGTYQVRGETMTSAGGRIGGGNPMAATTALGLPAGGRATNATFVLVAGVTGAAAAAAVPFSSAITVTGTVDASAVSVTVNGVPASLSAGTFSASVALTLGANVIQAVALDAVGNSSTTQVTVYLDVPAEDKQPTVPLTVSGTTDDPSASITVNGTAATNASGQFSANILVSLGQNTITATATDIAGNATSHAISVYLVPPPQPPMPPPMPTVGTFGPVIPAVTTQSSITIGGTKTAGTSIWINGALVVPADASTTWTASITLMEGDNVLLIVAKDAQGTSSSAVRRVVILDTVAPVVTFTPPTKTNLTPALLQGRVDDHQTVVTINGLADTLPDTADFAIPVPLTLGSNALQLTATSPNGYVTTANYVITLGTVPTIQSMSPPDGATSYVGAPVTVSVTATDAQADSMEYELAIDGASQGPWSPSPSTTITPDASDAGIHAVTVSVRDGYGGSSSQSIEVLILRAPVEHP